MAAISFLMAPPSLLHHHTPAAAKPITIPLSLSFHTLRPAHKYASASLSPTSKQFRTRLFAVSAEETAVSAEETTDAEPEEQRRLYVGNLRFSIDSDELRKIFEEHGAVEKAEVVENAVNSVSGCEHLLSNSVMYQKQYKKSRGFGFVTMKTIKDAEAAIEKLNGKEIKDFKLQVNITTRPLSSEEARRGPEEFIDSPYKVFVENLGKKMNARTLKKHFAERGNVLSAKVPVNPRTLKCAGFGYVTFSSAEDRDAAIASCNNTPLMGVKIRVTKL